MKAAVFSEFGGPEVLRLADRPEPEPRAGEVRIAVEAAVVHPFDLLTRAGAIVRAGMVPAPEHGFEWGLGWDCVGRIDAVGDEVDLQVGQRVLGMQPAIAVPTGAQAERVVLAAGSVAPAPEGVEPTRAATLPLDGLTALAAIEAAELAPGRHLVVFGGTGGIGWFAVQLALRAGLRVTATAGEPDAAHVRALGAEVVDRNSLPRAVDAVLDTPGIGAAALTVIRDGGTLVTVAGPVAGDRGIRSVQVRVSQLDRRAERLGELSSLAATGDLVLPVALAMPLADVAGAHRRLAAGGVGGRLVLVP
ncbi:NADP-dependent oxidoreductase [Nocardioides sp.]|uniref:NADP-dependent oxidoreductase n=1 Tax=Nocardioides sp. TaxID=35761 RepID=UPI003D09E379